MKSKPSTLTRRQIRELPDAPDGLKWFAVGPCCWGKSSSAHKALEIARSEGGRGRYLLHLVNDYAEVDPVSGTLRYNSQTPGIRINAGACTLR